MSADEEKERELQRAAENELKANIINAQKVIDKQMAKLRKEGVSVRQIQQVLLAEGAQMAHDLKRLNSALTPKSGTTQELAITITHPMQEILLMNQIKADPVRYKRVLAENKRYYDEYTVDRLVEDGTKKRTSVWFDITDYYQRFVDMTNRKATPAQPLPPGRCFNCGEAFKFENSKKCGACKSAYYCNKECQVNHWRNGHKEVCQSILKETAEVKAKLDAVEAKEAKEFKGLKEAIKALVSAPNPPLVEDHPLMDAVVSPALAIDASNSPPGPAAPREKS